MSVQVSWYVENAVLYAYGTGINELDDLRVMNDDVLSYIESSSGTGLIHFLIDLRDLKKMPSFSTQGKMYTYVKHPRAGWQVFIGLDDPIQRFTIFMLSEIMKIRFRRFSTIPEGIAFMQSIDGTLPDLTQYREKLVKQM
jgi:hypothetical protein